MKCNVLIAGLFFCATLSLYSMEFGHFILKSTEELQSFIAVPLKKAQSIPSMKKIIDNCQISGGQPAMQFVHPKDSGALKHVREYINYHYKLGKKVSGDEPRIEKNFYDYAKTLNMDALARLTNNVQRKLFENEKIIPHGLLEPLIEKVVSKKVFTIFNHGLPRGIATLVEEKSKAVIQSYEEKQNLLAATTINDNKNYSIITKLFAAYSHALDQVAHFPLYRKLPLFDNGVITNVGCSYIGRNIMVCCNQRWNKFTITIHWNNNNLQYVNMSEQIEPLKKPAIASINKIFVNDDESIVACLYKSVDDKQGLALIDKGGMLYIDISPDDKLCCFNDKYAMSGFDAQDNIFILPVDHDCAQKKIIKKIPGIKGMLYDSTEKELIKWTSSHLYIHKKAPINYCEDQDKIIENVIIDHNNRQLCVKLLESDNSYSYQFIDLNNYRHTQQLRINDVLPLNERFSPDGNLFIIYFTDKAGKDIYRFYDLLSLAFWEKGAKEKILAIGPEKSIEINKKGLLSNQVKCVTLLDEDMRDAFTLLLCKNYDPFEHSCEIVTLLSTDLFDQACNQRMREYPEEIQKIRAARPAVSSCDIKNTQQSLLYSIAERLFSYRYYVGGAALIATLWWKFGMTR